MSADVRARGARPSGEVSRSKESSVDEFSGRADGSVRNEQTSGRTVLPFDGTFAMGFALAAAVLWCAFVGVALRSGLTRRLLRPAAATRCPQQPLH